MMKKIAIISLCLLLGVSIAAAAPGVRQQQTRTLDTTGTFSADITYQRPGPNATIVNRKQNRNLSRWIWQTHPAWKNQYDGGRY